METEDQDSQRMMDHLHHSRTTSQYTDHSIESQRNTYEIRSPSVGITSTIVSSSLTVTCWTAQRPFQKQFLGQDRLIGSNTHADIDVTNNGTRRTHTTATSRIGLPRIHGIRCRIPYASISLRLTTTIVDRSTTTWSCSEIETTMLQN